MKITLGTAQLGLKYGIKNDYKIINKKESLKILNSIEKLKIKYIDTAQGYGNAEKILGKFNLKKINIITKLPKLDLKKDITSQLEYYSNISLKNLKKNSIYAMLIHNSEQLLSSKGEIIFEQLQVLKKKRKVKKIGYSLYDPETLKKIINKKLIPDIIQIPFNILDSRFEQNNYLNKLKNLKIEIHARSIFLQGLLLMNFNNLNSYFNKYEKIFYNFEVLARKLNLTNFELALYYVLQNNKIDNIVIGVDNYQNLKEIIMAKEKFNLRKNKKIIFNNNNFSKKLLNPSYWKL